jgi:hypothetical protein
VSSIRINVLFLRNAEEKLRVLVFKKYVFSDFAQTCTYSHPLIHTHTSKNIKTNITRSTVKNRKRESDKLLVSENILADVQVKKKKKRAMSAKVIGMKLNKQQ